MCALRFRPTRREWDGGNIEKVDMTIDRSTRFQIKMTIDVMFALIIAIVVVGALIHYTRRDEDAYRARIIQLSSMLQVAEYQTGVPYYSSQAPHYSCENPAWLYNHIRKCIVESPVAAAKPVGDNPVITAQ
jgi:hypothetical protein